VLAASASLVAVNSATANTYSVYSCKGPTGAPNAAAGWVAAPAASGNGTTANACAAGGALTAALAGPTVGGDASASWSFTTPPNTTITSITANRTTSGVSAGTQPNDVEYVLSTDQGTLEACAVSDTSSCVADLTSPLDKQGLNAGTASFRVLCTNAGSTCTRPLRADVSAVTIGLKDDSPPSVANVVVTDSGDLSGVLSLHFDAADLGGGLFRGIVMVDGQPATLIPFGDANCQDANPADADPFQFLVPVPCPGAAAAVPVNVDYRALPPGPHAISVSVQDAAGNVTSVYGPVTFPKPNIDVPAPTAAQVAQLIDAKLTMYFAKGRKAHYTSRYGRRVVTRGYLRDKSGKGVQGARIDVYHIIGNGKRKLLKTGLKTRAGGKLTLILPMNIDSRTIEYDYRALRPGKVTSSQTLKLRVMRHGRKFVRK